MSQVSEYLEGLRKSYGPRGGLPLSYKIIDQHGVSWSTVEHIKRGEPKACFGNSLIMALENGWYYVEGLAVPKGLFPLEHAWCMRPDGAIVDPTWDNGVDYKGVVFNTDFVVELVSTTGYYGVLAGLYRLRDAHEDVEQYLINGIANIGECHE